VPVTKNTETSKAPTRKTTKSNAKIADKPPGRASRVGKGAAALATKPGPRPRAGAKPVAAKPAATKPKAGPRAQPAPAKSSLKKVVIDALDDMKALEVKVLDVRGLTDIADFMVIASGTSDRHVRSVAQRVVEKTKQAGFRPHGVEGGQDADWVLIDLHEMIVHVMLPRVREFYGLEKLWDMTVSKRAAARA
jgi:ribosome-associated protein